MADNPYVNKVDLADGTTLVDLTGDTATESDVVSGKTFHLASGATGTGSMDVAGSITDAEVDSVLADSAPTGTASLRLSQLSRFFAGLKSKFTNTRVKGNAESTYRTGDVNLTPANIGAAATSDAIKSITRSGTTFTATRANGTTFTFTQQDNNTRVKGNAESTYRTGDVNLTPANIGAASTGEAVKSISRSGTTFTATRADGTSFTFDQKDDNTGLIAHQSTTSSESRYLKIAINATENWMLSFDLMIYAAYDSHIIRVSGYQYGANYWHAPKAVIVSSTSLTSIPVYFGYDSVNHLWVAVQVGGYDGFDIRNVTNGYVQVSQNGLFTITETSSIPTTNQTTVTAYPFPGNAISSISRSGTTFTATRVNGTTFTFTQQDNNTTYSTTSKTAAGLCPQLPNETTTKKYLRQDGTWQVPPDNNTTYSAGKLLSLSGTTFSIAQHPDTRNDNQPPSWYFTNYPRLTVFEFKYANKIEIGSDSVYCTLITVVPWTDSSGGYPVQYATVGNRIYIRTGSSASAWGSWSEVYDTSHKPTASDIGAQPAGTYIKSEYKNSYYGMLAPDGTSSGYIRTTSKGIIPYESGGSGYVGTSGWPFSYGYFKNGLYLNGTAVSVDGHTHSQYEPVMPVQTITKTLKLTTSWQDTGIVMANITAGSGTYVIQVSGITSSVSSIYGEIWSGIMSVYTGTTNSTDTDEIFLHKAGHASNGRQVYLRTVRVADSASSPKLQIATNVNWTGSSSVTFKFKKLI